MARPESFPPEADVPAARPRGASSGAAPAPKKRKKERRIKQTESVPRVPTPPPSSGGDAASTTEEVPAEPVLPACKVCIHRAKVADLAAAESKVRVVASEHSLNATFSV